jgi:HNH endonuclease
MDEARQFIIAFQDHAAPQLDVYEQAIYLYVARHTIMENVREAVIGFKSARKKMAFGTGKAGTPPSEGIVYEKLKGLERKGFLKILSSERTGTRVQICTPFEIEGLIQPEISIPEFTIEEADFFEKPAYRTLILERDGFLCFYCKRAVDENNYVIEHVVSRPTGTNSYKNLVSSCRQCNNRKDAMSADAFLRQIYREGLLDQKELADGLESLEALKRGDLKPSWPTA